MTKDDIIRMAREANLTDGIKLPHEIEAVERFASLVAAAEREACARVAESYEPRCDTCPSGVSNAIRARREQ